MNLNGLLDTNGGRNPFEYLLGALSTCTSIIVSYAAKEQDFEYSGLDFSADATLDPRGFRAIEDVTTYFQMVKINVTVKTNENDDQLRKLKETVEKRCPIFNY
ncbi:OsmC family protein [Virgibacillus byunsanensis]|uniref:OsmC family protein n=1 Tax=Virgibacillus byunsanensis TaxID=570945 RepID=A0ABW3LSD6_9BACI